MQLRPEHTKAMEYNHYITSGERKTWTAEEAQNYFDGYVQATQTTDRQDGQRVRTDVEILQHMEQEYDKDNREKPEIHRSSGYTGKYGIHVTPIKDHRGHILRAQTRLAEKLAPAETYEQRKKISHENNIGWC